MHVSIRSKEKSKRKGVGGFLRSLSRRQPSTSETTATSGKGTSSASSTEDRSSSGISSEIIAINIHLGPSLLVQHPRAREPEIARSRLQQEPTAEYGVRPNHVTVLSDWQAMPISVAPARATERQITAPVRRPEPSSPSSAAAARASGNPSAMLPQQCSQPKEPITIHDHTPSVEVCLDELSLHDAAPSLLLHNVPASPVAATISAEPQSDAQIVATSSLVPSDDAYFHQADEDVGILCRVGAHGFELAPSHPVDKFLPFVTVLSRNTLSSSVARTMAAKDDGTGSVDLESLEISSLCSSAMVQEEGSLSCGSSVSGILDDGNDDENMSMEAGYLSNIACVAFLDNLDENDVLCWGKEDGLVDNDSWSNVS